MSVYVFDLDGTIADSNGVWDIIDRELVRKSGASVPEDTAASMAAMGYEELYETLARYGICFPDINALRSQLDAIAEYEYANNVQLKKGADDFLRRMSELHRTVLFTASPERLYRPLLTRCGVYDRFDDLICSADIGADKNSSEGFMRLSSVLGVSPPECTVFEDSVLCAKSAAAAGMRVIGVYDAYSAHTKGYDIMEKITDRMIYDFETECV